MVCAPEIIVRQGLNERYYGDYSKSSVPVDTEAMLDFETRIQSTIVNILDFHEGDIIIISHQKVYEFLTGWLVGTTSKIDQGGVCLFQVVNTNYRIRPLN